MAASSDSTGSSSRRSAIVGAGAADRYAGESCFLVTQVASQIGSKPVHHGTLRALGLGRIGKSRLLPDRPEIRGMLSFVAHLVDVEATSAAHAPASALRSAPVKKGKKGSS